MDTMDKQSPCIRGYRFGAVAAGIKRPGSDKLDLGLIVADTEAIAAGITTTNVVYAAPVTVTRQVLSVGRCRAVLINSGNANACTGQGGMHDALRMCSHSAELLEIAPDLVIPMSTGVIGAPMPMDRIMERIPEMVQGLDPNGALAVAKAMMTTDTREKLSLRTGINSTGPFSVLGMAKGSGMIAPRMATMLGVVLTDLRVPLPLLRDAVVCACHKSFNRITVDGDTSTNDTVVVLSGGAVDAPELGASIHDREAFAEALDAVCSDLARQIVADGEGATKLVEVLVRGVHNEEAAEILARTIAESPLVKTAFHGEDPNWGRILCAAGRSGVFFDTNRVDLYIGDVAVMKDGRPAEGDWETPASREMANREFRVTLDLKSGSAEAAFLTTDLSAEYVRINADYRS